MERQTTHQESDAEHCSRNANSAAEGRDDMPLHLDIDNSSSLSSLQKRNLVILCVVAYGTIQTTLSLVEIFAAHCVPHNNEMLKMRNE